MLSRNGGNNGSRIDGMWYSCKSCLWCRYSICGRNCDGIWFVAYFNSFSWFHYTGTSVNPARSIAPAVFQGGQALSELWVFVVGPFVGAILAAIVWKIVGSDCCKCKK